MSLPSDCNSVPLAIIGMGCRLPGAENLDQYWRLILEGRSAIAEMPAERFDQRLYFDAQKGVRGKSYSKMAALLANREFDHVRYPIDESLRQAVDQNHLMMVGVAADALRHAGLDPFNLRDRNCSVYIGNGGSSKKLRDSTYDTYLVESLEMLDEVDLSELSPAQRDEVRRQCIAQIRAQYAKPKQGDARYLHCNMMAGVISKAFHLTGSFLALNSACASSLQAILMGARSLQLGETDMIIVGGASDIHAHTLVLFSQAQALSTCASRPFDHDADGLVMSEGYVALVMKTLEKALADGDPIQAVVRGLGVATDGRGKSLWAPRKEGQIKAMRRAYRSGVELSGLQYLECHATATQLGDATELETLAEVLRPEFPAGKQIPVTSVKANIGHALEAAGIAGLIKTVLSIQNKTIPPAINIRSLNPKIDWKSAPYYVPMQPAPWEAPAAGQPRRAAVNAFGIGGLNMHVVLDEFTPSARNLVRPVRPATSVAVGLPVDSADDQAVAVIGMSCIFPGAAGLEKFWQALQSGTDPKTTTDPRWASPKRNSLDKDLAGGKGGFIQDFNYDWRKHRVPPKQVAEADPLQFMLLEAAEQALADAGYPAKPFDRERCGVVVGTEVGGDFCNQLEMGLRLPEIQDVLTELLLGKGLSAERITAANAKFADVLLQRWPSLIDETGSFTSSTLASRVTKTLDLAGGAAAVDSGTTSSLSALAVCCDMLLAGDNDMMICAAGQRQMGLGSFDAISRRGGLASGEARNLLDANYDGIVPGEGVGVLLLKRLSDARRDGDKIHAVLRGIGMAHHASQPEALRLAADRALQRAGITSADLQFAELETDERLSADSSELTALAGSGAPRQTPLLLGSPTAQFGHLCGAAGIIGLVKAILEVEHDQVVPTVGLEKTNSAISGWAKTVARGQQPARIGGRRLGAVVGWSKGLAGVVLVEHGSPVVNAAKVAAPAATRQTTATTAPKHVAPASVVSTVHVAGNSAGTAAHSAAASASAAWKICRFAAATHEDVLAQVDRALQDAQTPWRSTAEFQPTDRYRLAVVADSAEALLRKLQLARGQLTNLAARSVLEQQGVFYREVPTAAPRVVWVFPGQGSQYEGMLQQLVADVPAAKQALNEIDATLDRLGYPRFEQLAWPRSGTASQLGSDIWITQLSMLVANSLTLAALRSRGLSPAVALGHSYGEFAALYSAGAWDFATAVQLTRARCAGVATAPAGTALLATDATPDVIEHLAADISPEIYIANYNAPDQCVVGGRREHLEKLVAPLQLQSRQARILAVPAAFHTPWMRGASDLLRQALQGATIGQLQTPVISTVTNRAVGSAAELRQNLADQLTTPVRYAALIAELAKERPTVFVEVGPQQTLTRLNRRILDGIDGAAAIACDNPKRPGLEPLLHVQALLECLGATSQPTQHPAPPASQTPSATLAKAMQEPTRSGEIPHFDATERRRTRLRTSQAGHSPETSARPKPVVAPPVAPIAPQPASPVASKPVVAKPEATHRANGSHATAAISPAPSTRPHVNGSAHHGANGSAAESAAHHQPAPVAKAAAPQFATTPQAAAPTATVKTRTPKSAEQLESFLINFVVEQTGYPPEVVDLDADLEADLGIDSIKKAQLFGELNEYFDLGSAVASLSLDDFPTLRHVLTFLQKAEGGAALASAAPAAPTVVPQATAPAAPPVVASPVASAAVASAPVSSSPAPAAATKAPAAEQLESFLINFVVEQTGYPPEVVDLDADLEADLGIDSIKKAQLFGELNEYFDLGSAVASLSLDDFPTLRHVLSFLQNTTAASPASAAAAVAPVAPVVAPAAVAAPVSTHAVPSSNGSSASTSSPTPATAELESFLINFVVEQTGYPPEVVDLDADLEADLGIDSIKKAQLFGELNEYFDLGSAVASLSLDDFPTLRHVLAFLQNACASGPAPDEVVSHSYVAPSNSPASPREPSPPSPSFAAPTTLLSSASSAVAVAEAAPAAEELESFLINFVVEQTGYPPEVVDLDADLEADLGIDSIKKAQLFGELNEYFDLGSAVASLSLDDFPTLRHVLTFLQNAQGAAPAADATLADEETATATHVNGHGSLGGFSNPAAHTNGHGAAYAQVAPVSSVVTAAGKASSPYELGWQYGLAHQQEIRQSLRAYAGMASGQQAAALEHPETLLSADQLDGLQGMADAVEVPLGNLLAQHLAVGGATAPPAQGVKHLLSQLLATISQSVAATKLRAEPALPSLPGHGVCGRYIFEMREAPLPAGTAAEPAWSGAAIVVGQGPTAAALAARLQRSGVVTHVLSTDQDLDTLLRQVEQIAGAGPVPYLFLTAGRDGLPLDYEHADVWPSERQAMALPLLVCQQWVRLAARDQWLDRCTLVATTAEEGDFGFSRGSEYTLGGALAGLLKGVFVEFSVMQKVDGLRVKVIDAPIAEPLESLVNNVLRELAANNRDCEIAYVNGRRLTPSPLDQPAAAGVSGIRSGATWVVTGGARGITARCALEVAQRYDLKLHLIGSTPLASVDPAWRSLDEAGLQQLKVAVMIEARKQGQNAMQAWQRTQKDLEIDRAMRAFAAAGVSVVYHACDVADRDALAQTLEQVRQQDGPIEGILHGAGIERSCRFEKKQREVVQQTIDIKVGGAGNLMALTRRDPIRHFIGFGSVSGRLGGFGQTDYCLANEMLAKLVGGYRRQRPWIRAVTFHWHAWGELGMAARPELKEILEGAGGLTFMPPDEGVAHLLRELAGGTPNYEVVITESRHLQPLTSSADQAEASAPKPALIQNVRAEGNLIVADVLLDPLADPFLVQHRLRGKPLLPVVAGLEAIGEIASAAGGRSVVGFHAVDMVDGLLFHADRPLSARVSASPRADGLFDCELTCDFHNRAGGLIKKDRVYLKTTVELAGAILPQAKNRLPQLDPAAAFNIAYPDHALVYHGPPFRGLVTCYPHVEAGQGWSKIMALPLADLTGPARAAGWRLPSVLMDSAMYACGLHLWVAANNALGLPRGISHLELGRAPQDGEACWMHFTCRSLDAQRPAYDFEILGSDGALILRASDYYKVVFGQGDAL